MALGVPAISFDCPSGPREITNDGRDALLVPPGDKSRLLAGLALLMEDEPFRRALGQRGAIGVKDRYAMQSVLRVWGAVSILVMALRPTRFQPRDSSYKERGYGRTVLDPVRRR